MQKAAAAMDETLLANPPSEAPGFCRGHTSVADARRLVTHAHKLCYTTHAPPGWVPGQAAAGQLSPASASGLAAASFTVACVRRRA